MHKLIAIILIFLLSACATPYQSQGAMGGFNERRLDTNAFEVSFAGNGYTKTSRAIDFTLMRSAEIAIQGGFNYFVIVDSNSYVETTTRTTPGRTRTNTYSDTLGYAHNTGDLIIGSAQTITTTRTTRTPGYTLTERRPSAKNIIVCYKEKPEGANFYHAKDTFHRLAAKYNIGYTY